MDAPNALSDNDSSDSRLELKRARQRAYVKQAYDRHKRTRDWLQRQVALLETQYADLINIPASGRELPVKNEEDVKPSEQLLLSYQRITELKCRLYEEKVALLEAREEFAKRCSRLQQLLDENVKTNHFQPTMLAEYERVLNESRLFVLRFLSETSCDQPVAHVLGWSHRSYVDPSSDLHSFSRGKHFAISASELFKRTWRLLSTPAKYSEIYSPSVRVDVHLLQYVNDDTLLYYTEIDEPSEPKGIKSVYLLRRERYSKGHLIMLRTVEPNPLGIESVERGGRRVWTEAFTWLVFEDAGPKGCAFQTCGRVRGRAWAFETMMMAMRWQVLAVGHDQLLLPEEDTIKLEN